MGCKNAIRLEFLAYYYTKILGQKYYAFFNVTDSILKKTQKLERFDEFELQLQNLGKTSNNVLT